MLKEAETMVAQQISNLKINKKTTPEVIQQEKLSLKKRCTVTKVVVTVAEAAKGLVAVAIETVVIEAMEVDIEIVVVSVTEAVTEVMEVVVAYIVKVLKCLLLLKAILLTCFPIISAFKQTHNSKIFTFTRLITVFSMTLEIETLALVLLSLLINNYKHCSLFMLPMVIIYFHPHNYSKV